MTCPECGKTIEADWQRCAHCGASLAEPRKPSVLARDKRRAWVEEDVRRDSRGIGVGVIVLAVLGGIGLVQILAVAGSAAIQGQRGPFIGVIYTVALLALITSGFMLSRYNPDAIGVARIMVNTLALLGFLFLLLLALLVFVFVVCVAAVIGSGAMR
jgi:hypothetical protein